MPSHHPRDKQLTRARISDAASGLFQAHGFEHVTVNDVAHAAGVSKVTVFAHFPRKEDLFIDRGPEAAALITEALRDRPDGTTPLQALRKLAETLARRRHPLTGLTESSLGFFRTLAASPALIARAREIGGDIEDLIGRELRADTSPPRHPDLIAALVVAAYRTVLTDTAARAIAGQSIATIAARQRKELAAAFDAIEAAVRSLEPES